MSKPVELFVSWCAFMPGLGSPLSYVSIHNIHHKHFSLKDRKDNVVKSKFIMPFLCN